MLFIRNFFRNEAIFHLKNLASSSDLFSFIVLYWNNSVNFRPVAYLLWWGMFQIFGLFPLPYIAVNGVFFIASIVLLGFVACKTTGKNIALMVIALYVFLFPHLNYCIGNAIYGIFYPLLMFWLLLYVYFLWHYLNLEKTVFLFLTLLSALAAWGTHAFSFVLLPAITFVLFSLPIFRKTKIKMIFLLFLVSGSLYLLFQMQNIAQIDHPTILQADNPISYAFARVKILSELLFLTPFHLLLFIAAVQHFKRYVYIILTLIALAMILWFSGFAGTIRLAGIVLLLLWIVFEYFINLKKPQSLWALFCIAGFFLFIVNNDAVAAYMQPFVYSLVVLLAFNVYSLFENRRLSLKFQYLKPALLIAVGLVYFASFTMLYSLDNGIIKAVGPMRNYYTVSQSSRMTKKILKYISDKIQPAQKITIVHEKPPLNWLELYKGDSSEKRLMEVSLSHVPLYIELHGLERDADVMEVILDQNQKEEIDKIKGGILFCSDFVYNTLFCKEDVFVMDEIKLPGFAPFTKIIRLD